MNKFQKTIARSVSFTGVGLHSGSKVSVTLHPADAWSGYQFLIRTPLDEKYIKTDLSHVSDTRLCTSLKCGGASIRTVEHLLAALSGLEIDNALIEITGNEIPILDGSALPFTQGIQEAGVIELQDKKQYLITHKPLDFSLQGASAHISPDDIFKITYTITFTHPLINTQTYAYVASVDSFQTEIAPARTFGFYADIEQLREAGLIRGGSFENAIVIGEQEIINTTLRFPNEFVRHKILDAVGDFSLVGTSIIGNFLIERGGHHFHLHLMQFLLSQKDAYYFSS